jgi:hypothetical protein
LSKTNLTAQQVRTLFDYDPGTGVFKRIAARQGAKRGALPGHISRNGYHVISIDHRHHFTHRLAWLYMTGAWPAADIDHINGLRADNRWNNLRATTRGENMQNLKCARKDNKSCGLLGVTWDKQCAKWKARIGVRGKTLRLGHFDDPDTAHAAYLTAKRALHSTNTL